MELMQTFLHFFLSSFLTFLLYIGSTPFVKPLGPNDLNNDDNLTEEKLREGRRTLMILSVFLVFLQAGQMLFYWDSSFWTPVEIVCISGTLLGFALRMWSVLTLGKHFTNIVGLRQGHQLITHGPYRLLLHPSYTGSLIQNLFFLMHFRVHWLIRLLLVVQCVRAWIPFMRGRLNAEEAMLRRQFGAEFDCYAASRYRLVPFVY
eukprot:TRINITY_DN27660_c0_g1_i1.p1 TRINITY_DN27660_c0_g1~~TRINITY_DN27660_c0_g1_i1.p1  ORF type:complete len:218 (-),score=15.00 TRINITY_DN27660_c0_g1_i1:109-720(-)